MDATSARSKATLRRPPPGTPHCDSFYSTDMLALLFMYGQLFEMYISLYQCLVTTAFLIYDAFVCFHL
jgi:hypothetical protein